MAILPAVAAGGARAGTARSTAVRTADAAIRQLNAERAANGIPGRIVENRSWSERCLEHARWMQRNHLVQHDETPGTPMYTAAGAWAGVRSVLSGGYPWTTRRTPWDSAPMHLAQLLAPQLRQMGIGLFRGWACATTLPGYGRGRAHRNVVYTYPSGGTLARWREHANEFPFTPQGFVGIDPSQTTGPYLLVFADGPWLSSPEFHRCFDSRSRTRIIFADSYACGAMRGVCQRKFLRRFPEILAPTSGRIATRNHPRCSPSTISIPADNGRLLPDSASPPAQAPAEF